MAFFFLALSIYLIKSGRSIYYLLEKMIAEHNMVGKKNDRSIVEMMENNTRHTVFLKYISCTICIVEGLLIQSHLFFFTSLNLCGSIRPLHDQKPNEQKPLTLHSKIVFIFDFCGAPTIKFAVVSFTVFSPKPKL